MIARAIESLFYTSAVRGTHRALSDMGFIGPASAGSQAEQVRAVIGQAEAVPALSDEPAADSKKEKKSKP